MSLAINSDNFENTVKNGGVVVIDFWAQWCGPCRQLAPTIDELSSEYEGKAVFCKCDVDENPEIASQFGVMNIPMLAFIRDGEMSDMTVGLVQKDVIKEKVDNLLK